MQMISGVELWLKRFSDDNDERGSRRGVDRRWNANKNAQMTSVGPSSWAEFGMLPWTFWGSQIDS